MWTGNIWCVLRVKPQFSNSSGIVWTGPYNSLCQNDIWCFLPTEMSRWKVQSWWCISLSSVPCRSLVHEWLHSNTTDRVFPRNIQSCWSWYLPCMSFRDTFWYCGIILFTLSSRALMWWSQSIATSMFLFRILEQWWRGRIIIYIIRQRYLGPWARLFSKRGNWRVWLDPPKKKIKPKSSMKWWDLWNN